ncbi:MAG: methyl-accepting chemotaxis protein [Cereibacter sphaeroides]|uniref:Methyl-accepting chemotaxis protein n=1 Tax=Cereibacter sphaeroides TaxID=1063 RepID=A0A2W5U8Y2_CERSP|nr:MAG: methyl-accepting chemotaxis protein [Cereibacter sphaeroides]
MKIARLIPAAALGLVTLLLLSAAIAAFGIDRIRVGGPLQQSLQRSSDLVADILPPPAYVIEAYLEANQIIIEPEKQDEHIARLMKLRQAFDERHAYWSKQPLAPNIRQILTNDTYVPAERFWHAIDMQMIPAARQGNREGTIRAFAQVRQAYLEHRKAIDRLVAAAMQEQRDLVDRSHHSLTVTIIILAALGLAMLICLAVAIHMLMVRVVTPLVKIADVTKRLADGQHCVVPATDRTDELGELAGAVEYFRVTTRQQAEIDARDNEEKTAVTNALGDMLGGLASGDLRNQLSISFPPAYAAVGTNLNLAMANLRSMVQAVVFSADGIRNAANEISVATDDLSWRTQTNAASLSETAQALVMVDEQITQSRTATEETAEVAVRARALVNEGLGRIASAAQAMDQVQSSAEHINAVMEALDKIAFQTRVLAMNAAVEAGNAGEAGRGFAVVAELVSQLALRAEQEAHVARSRITETSEFISNAAENVRAVEAGFGSINGDVQQVDDLMQRLLQDSEAQAEMVKMIAQVVQSMDTMTQQNAAMVEEASAACRSLLTDTETMVNQTNQFKWDRREIHQSIEQERRDVAPKYIAAGRDHSTSTSPLLH